MKVKAAAIIVVAIVAILLAVEALHILRPIFQVTISLLIFVAGVWVGRLSVRSKPLLK